jgi:hypothetical protein
MCNRKQLSVDEKSTSIHPPFTVRGRFVGTLRSLFPMTGHLSGFLCALGVIIIYITPRVATIRGMRECLP